MYLVKHQRLGKTFALKETFFSNDQQLRKAFEREAQLLANLDHPALPRVTDHFAEGESLYLVMEYIPGEDLGTQLEANEKPFPSMQVCEWADQLLDALEYLHTNDPPIIHRDIKPANLKLTSRGKIVLLDFGLAKGETTEMSRMSRSVFGYTPNYAPLEQVQSEGTDARTDLYSLAATLYHLMTGQIPPRVTARLAAVADGQPDPLRPANEVNADVPVNVALVLQQAMARSRNQRPESATAMRRALLEAARFIMPPKVVDLPHTVIDSEQWVSRGGPLPTIPSPTVPSSEAQESARIAEEVRERAKEKSD